MRIEASKYIFAWCPQCWDHGDHKEVARGLECIRCKGVHENGVVIQDGLFPFHCGFCGDRSAAVICEECRQESD